MSVHQFGPATPVDLLVAIFGNGRGRRRLDRDRMHESTCKVNAKSSTIWGSSYVRLDGQLGMEEKEIADFAVVQAGTEHSVSAT